MANPTADFPTALHTVIDTSLFSSVSSKLGSTSPTHTAVHGKIEQEVLAIQTKLGLTSSTPSSGKVLYSTNTGESTWTDLNTLVDSFANVTSVNGQTGAVSLTTTNIAEGTNQYFTNARARSALSATAPIAYDSATGIISSAQANTSTNGYLSSTDWNTFNNKQAALAYTPLNPANNLSELTNAATARTNLGLVAAGAGDIWVEKAGDTMTGALVINTATGNALTTGAVSLSQANNVTLSLGTLTGGTSTNYQLQTGTVTAIANSTAYHLNIGATVGAAGATYAGINVGAVSGAGTFSALIDTSGGNASTATNNYGIKVGNVTGVATNNYALFVGVGVNASGKNFSLYVQSATIGTNASPVYIGNKVVIGESGTETRPNSMVYVNNNATGAFFTAVNTNFKGMEGDISATITSGATTGVLAGFSFRPIVETPNTQNWTDAVGIRAINATSLIRPTSGTITGAALLYGQNDAGTGGTVTNYYAMYIESLTRGTNNYGIVLLGTNRSGFGVATPTALIHLAAGTATASTAPLKFTTGTVLTSAEAGAMEYNNKFSLTESDATRRFIVQAVNATKTTAAAPYTNDGYLTMTINGTDFKLMTTA